MDGVSFRSPQSFELQDLFGGFSQPFVILDVAGTIRWGNASYWKMSQFAESLSLEKPFLVPGPESFSHHSYGLLQYLSQGERFQFSLLNYNGSQHPYWVRIEAQPLPLGEQGQWYLVSCKNLQEGLEKEKEFQWLTDLFNATQQLAKLGGWELDVATGQTVWTDGVYEIHEVEKGFPHNERNGIEFYHPDYRSVIQEALMRAISDQVDFDVICKFITAKNNPLWVKVLGYPVVENGKVIRIIGLFQDITDQLTIHENLKTERRRLADIIAGTNVGTWEWDIQTGTAYFDDQWAQIVGYTLAELQPNSFETWTELTHTEDLEKARSKLQAHFSRELNHYEVEIRMRHKAGHWVWVLSRGKVVRWSAEGTPLFMSGTHQDISERKISEFKLLDAQKDLEQWIYSVSHDLRTPLSYMEAYVEWLEQEGNDQIQPYVQDLAKSIHRMDHMTQDLLNFAWARSVQLSKAWVSLQEIVEECRELFRQDTKARNIRWEIELLPEAFVDRTMMVHVFENLFSNAIKFTRPINEPCISVFHTVDEPQQELHLYVQDNGIGFAEEEQEKMFNIFHRLSETNHIKGNGIGLTTVQRIIHRHGGRVSAKGKPQKGACFILTLPMIESASPNLK